jgi:hypothetical protein
VVSKKNSAKWLYTNTREGVQVEIESSITIPVEMLSSVIANAVSRRRLATDDKKAISADMLIAALPEKALMDFLRSAAGSLKI